MKGFFKTFEVVYATNQIMIELGRKPGFNLFKECWDASWKLYFKNRFFKKPK